MIHTTEQQVVDLLNDRLEDLKKVVKSYSKYTTEVQSEFEFYYKKLALMVKQYQPQVQQSKEDLINLAPQINEFIQILDFISKTKLTQLNDFTSFLGSSLEVYNDRMNGFTKNITDANYQKLKALLYARTTHKKTQEKYQKLQKEIDSNLNQSKKSQNDANTGYNVGLSEKNDAKLRELVQQIKQAEVQYQELTEGAAQKSKEFDVGINESSNELLEALIFSQQKVIEITMKQDQHRLLANNWIKGYLDEKLEKNLQHVKLESDQEDKIISLKYEQENQQFKYTDIIEKLISQQPVSDQEYLAFPDILHKHIDGQLQIVKDRVKNLQLLTQMIQDLSQSTETSSQKIQAKNKQSLVSIQERNEKEKSQFVRKVYLIQELQTQTFEGYVKRYQNQVQIYNNLVVKLDSIFKDQKNTEKSFLNMYQKMIKDIQQAKSSLQDSENKPQLREQALNQLKKQVKDGALVIKYSLDQVRQNEGVRTQQILAVYKELLLSLQNMVDENIKATKNQEEILNLKFDQIREESTLQVQQQIPYEHIEVTFKKSFELTDEIALRIEQVQVSQQQDDDDEDKNLEEGSVKVSSKLLEKFRVQQGENCLASYACAFEDKILLQGRMYIFTTRICFHSYFNNKTLFGKTIIVIPSAEIQQVKRAKVYLVDVGIEFKTNKGLVVFTSFTNRESTINQIRNVKGLSDKIIEEIDDSAKIQQESPVKEQQQSQSQQVSQQKPLLQPQQIESQPQSIQKEEKQEKQEKQQASEIKNEQDQPTQQVQEPVVQPFEEKQNINQQPKQQQQSQPPQLQVEPQPQPQQLDIQNLLLVQQKDLRYMNQPNAIKYHADYNISVEKFAQVFLFDTPYEGQISFNHYFLQNFSKDKEIDYKIYQPYPQWGSSAKRFIQFVHPVREKSMFAPETASCIAEDTLYLISKQQVLFERELSFSKIPYGDHFVVRSYQYLTSTNEGCKLEYGFYVHFLKKTMFQGKIETGSKSENIETWEKGLKVMYQNVVSKLSGDQTPVQQIATKQQQQQVQQQPSQQIQQIQLQVDDSLYQKIMIEQKDKRFMNSSLVIKFQQEFDISVEEFTENLLFDKQYGQYLSFFHQIQALQSKDTQIVYNKYDPEPQWGKQTSRVIKFIHPIKKQMLAPDSVVCTATDTLYLFNKDEVLQEKEVAFAKIPYADCFVARTYHHLKQQSKGCLLEYGFYIHFMKSSAFKGKIESNSKSENTEFWEKIIKLSYLEEQKLIQNQRVRKDVIIAPPQQQQLIEPIRQTESTAPSLNSLDKPNIVQNVQQQQISDNAAQRLERLIQILIVLVSVNILVTIIK